MNLKILIQSSQYHTQVTTGVSAQIVYTTHDMSTYVVWLLISSGDNVQAWSWEASRIPEQKRESQQKQIRRSKSLKYPPQEARMRKKNLYSPAFSQEKKVKYHLA